MKIRETYAYDKVNDATLKPYKNVQVIMMRGLVSSWKQPIYFDFDQRMTQEILFKVVKFIEDAGFYVCSIVSDLGGGNRGLYRDLAVDEKKPWFLNPDKNHKIFVLADVHHLLKLIRNNFLDYGFLISENTEINQEPIVKLLSFTGDSDLRITHKISLHNLTVNGPQRQKVKFAAKLFSHTISQAINRCGTMGLFTENENWVESAMFFKLVRAVRIKGNCV